MPRLLSIMLPAFALLMSACATTPHHPPPKIDKQKAAKINVKLGANYLRQGNLKQSKVKLERALEQAPDSPTAHWTYALLQQRLGDDHKAEQQFQKAISLDPEDARAHNNYGTFLCRNGRVEEAERQFMQAVGNPLYQYPESAYTNAGICVLDARGEHNDKAESYFRQALRARPDYASALLHMAELSYQRERYLQTRAFVQRFDRAVRPNARSLWLGYQAEEKLGNAKAAFNYGLKLKNLFPQSRETSLLLQREGNEF